MIAEVFDGRVCELGEGPLWHPLRKQLFWFDIQNKVMMTQGGDGPGAYEFDRFVSAAGWIDADRLLVATDRDLITFDLRDGAQTHVTPMEADTPVTRPNDGRADPFGGFWISTMGHDAERGAGALYRYHRGTFRALARDLTIPNAICFAPSGDTAYFTDTVQRLVWRIALGPEGWPEGDWQVYLDHRDAGLSPDGAVVDANGIFWCAEWGAARVAGYDADGKLVEEVSVPASQVTCPAFGGDDLRTMFITTAAEGLSQADLSARPASGQTFRVSGIGPGQAEHRVIL